MVYNLIMHAKARQGNSDIVAPALPQQAVGTRLGLTTLQERSDYLHDKGGRFIDVGWETLGSQLVQASEWADRAIRKGFNLYAGELLAEWESATNYVR